MSALAFFIMKSPYAIFKIQTWFMPLLIPLFIYTFYEETINQSVIKIACFFILSLSMISSAIYVRDFIVVDENKKFTNFRAVTGNHDIAALAKKINELKPSELSLYLTNGVEAAWLMNKISDVTPKNVAHNFQPLQEKDYPLDPCHDIDSHHFEASGLLITTNPSYARNDITEPPQGSKPFYINPSYSAYDFNQVHSFVYMGKGAYPVELVQPSPHFPSKIRWVEKGVEIIVYSNRDRFTNILMEITPGPVKTNDPVRHFLIKSHGKEYHYSLAAKGTLEIKNIKVNKGLTCISLESPDIIHTIDNYKGILRKNVTLDSRKLNFTISNVRMTPI